MLWYLCWWISIFLRKWLWASHELFEMMTISKLMSGSLNSRQIFAWCSLRLLTLSPSKLSSARENALNFSTAMKTKWKLKEILSEDWRPTDLPPIFHTVGKVCKNFKNLILGTKSNKDTQKGVYGSLSLATKAIKSCQFLHWKHMLRLNDATIFFEMSDIFLTEGSKIISVSNAKRLES